MAGKVRRVKLRVGEPGEITLESLPASSVIKLSRLKSDVTRTFFVSAVGLINLVMIASRAPATLRRYLSRLTKKQLF